MNYPPLRVRIVQILFLLLAVAATFALAWWQWTRFRSGSGSFQNLGYALQWPAFGFFFIYAYRKYLHYEKELAEGKAPRDTSLHKKEERTEIPQDFYPTVSSHSSSKQPPVPYNSPHRL